MLENKAIKYYEIVCRELQLIIKLTSNEERNMISRSFVDEIQGIENTTLNPKKHSPKSYFIANVLYRPLSEIITSFESLENIKIYVNCFPYKNKQISKQAYLRYHIENYLNELYILKNRMISYLNLLIKAYKHSTLNQKVTIKLSQLCTDINTAFKSYINTRSSHVHQNRYHSFDLGRLSTFELLISSGNDDITNFLNDLYIQSYKDVRKKWLKIISNDLKNLKLILEYYFEDIMFVIVNNEEIIYPNPKWV